MEGSIDSEKYIENIIASKMIVEKTKPQTVEDLKKVIIITWNEIS